MTRAHPQDGTLSTTPLPPPFSNPDDDFLPGDQGADAYSEGRIRVWKRTELSKAKATPGDEEMGDAGDDDNEAEKKRKLEKARKKDQGEKTRERPEREEKQKALQRRSETERDDLNEDEDSKM